MTKPKLDQGSMTNPEFLIFFKLYILGPKKAGVGQSILMIVCTVFDFL